MAVTEAVVTPGHSGGMVERELELLMGDGLVMHDHGLHLLKVEPVAVARVAVERKYAPSTPTPWGSPWTFGCQSSDGKGGGLSDSCRPPVHEYRCQWPSSTTSS